MGARTYLEEVLVVWQLSLHVLICSSICLLVIRLEEEGAELAGLFLLIALSVHCGRRS